MSADMIAALAQVGTFIVVLGSVVAALIQLRHIRAGNQLQALLSLERDFRATALQSALSYVQEQLPQRLEDPEYRRQLETIGFVDPAVHPEMVACNWLNEMGTLVKRGYVSEDTFMDLFARLIVHCWREVSPAIAILRRKRGEGQYHDFEYLAIRASAWLRRNAQGTFPRAIPRAPLPDQWREIDRGETAES
ncbi:MAG: hypothetical protein JO113_00305 [Candidatus Eremiobacteraeota bacterium]|nr:hypothetical protein [Candidatus Eremiobacteraeota bacterium]